VMGAASLSFIFAPCLSNSFKHDPL
jgi:hypothetical protein